MLSATLRNSGELSCGPNKKIDGKCKVNWEVIFRLTKLGGLCIFHLERFARALRMSVMVVACMDCTRNIWVGLRNPCDETDMELFYVTATISNRSDDRLVSDTWYWLGGKRAKDCAPLIFEIF